MEPLVEELTFGESYRFKVTVENNGTRFAGELCLGPEACTLVVGGDQSEGRSQAFDWTGVDEMVCDGFHGTFLLHSLRGLGGEKHAIQRYPKSISHFEVRYSVSHVIFSKFQRYMPTTFIGVDFHSSSIARWVGYTHMQDTIVTKYHDGTLFRQPGEFYAEFTQLVPGLGSISVAYYPSSRYSTDEFSMGLHFAPVLSLTFDVPKTGAEVIRVVNEIESLFSFFCEAPLNIEKIKLVASDGRMHPLSMYATRLKDESTARKYPLFPLGINQRIDHTGLPPLPVESLSKYFCLPEAERIRFSKYIRYRHLKNPEERFLGFFRLLEKLCFQKESYLPEEKLSTLLERSKALLIRYFDDKKNVERVLERLIGWNNSKLDTAGCIAKFMKTLPNDLRKQWIYQVSDISHICKLRNDLTHANEVEPDTPKIEQKAKFIEALLVIRLMLAIGVPVESAASIAPRIQEHFLIEQRAVDPVATLNA